MQELAKKAMEKFGIPGLILMENAGRGIFEPICRHFAARLHQGVTILVGPGLYFMGQLIFPLSSSKTSF
jgi:NAD(P)H-hydrate epimerase